MRPLYLRNLQNLSNSKTTALNEALAYIAKLEEELATTCSSKAHAAGPAAQPEAGSPNATEGGPDAQ